MVSCPHALIAVICLMALAHTSARVLRTKDFLRSQTPDSAEASVRIERSANISQIIGTSRKIQLFVNKQWHLQIHTDGTVNGTSDMDSDFTILQRSSVSNLQITIQGVATCQFLCMDSCGLLYGARFFSDECIFNEIIESHHFNTYSSVKHSNDKRTLYLAFTKKGVPRKVQTKANAPIGKFATFANVLTLPVPPARVEQLFLKIMSRKIPRQIAAAGGSGHLPLRHHGYHHLCSYLPLPTTLERDQKCHRQQKKKKKRKCGDAESEDCGVTSRLKAADKKKCEDGEEEEECTRRLHMIRKKRKSRAEADKAVVEDGSARRKRLKLAKKRDFSDKNLKIREQCLYISKSDEQAFNNCVLKKGLRKKLRLEQSAVNNPKSTVSDRFNEQATESLLWQDQLGSVGHEKSVIALDTITRFKEVLKLPISEEGDSTTDFSSDWTTSAAEPN